MNQHSQQIAVIICTKDRPAALERCLIALINGNALPGEAVVVDQGQGDIKSALQRLFDRKHVKLQHIRMHESGVSRGRNLGVAHSHSEWLAFTDDDCVPAATWLETLDRAGKPDIDGVSGRVLPLPDSRPDMVAVSSRLSTTRRIYRQTGPHAPWEVGTGGNLLLRRSAFDRVGGFDARLGPGAAGHAAEDIDLLYRLLQANATFAFEPDALVFHEMKTRLARLRGRYPYAYGMGAFFALRRQAGDSGVNGLLRRYVVTQAINMLSAIKQRDQWRVAEAANSLRGVALGIRFKTDASSSKMVTA